MEFDESDYESQPESDEELAQIKTCIKDNDDKQLDKILREGHGCPTDSLFELMHSKGPQNLKLLSIILHYNPDLR